VRAYATQITQHPVRLSYATRASSSRPSRLLRSLRMGRQLGTPCSPLKKLPLPLAWMRLAARQVFHGSPPCRAHRYHRMVGDEG
jgi:hypothetical protein